MLLSVITRIVPYYFALCNWILL